MKQDLNIGIIATILKGIELKVESFVVVQPTQLQVVNIYPLVNALPTIKIDPNLCFTVKTTRKTPVVNIVYPLVNALPTIEIDPNLCFTVKTPAKLQVVNIVSPLVNAFSPIEIAPSLCFTVKSNSDADKTTKTICSRDKRNELYSRISKINEEVIIEFLQTQELNPFYHIAPYLCGTSEVEKGCDSYLTVCDLEDSSFWRNEDITLPTKSASLDKCEMSKKGKLSNEKMKTISYLATFYKNRIPFNPENIDYYLQCLGYLKIGESAFDIICIKNGNFSNISKDILYRDWQKLGELEKDKYTISNSIYIMPEYRTIVKSDIESRQGKYSIGMRESRVVARNYVALKDEEFIPIKEIIPSLIEEIARIERIVDIEEYTSEVSKLEDIKKSIENMILENKDKSDILLLNHKLNEFAKIVADTFDSI